MNLRNLVVAWMICLGFATGPLVQALDSVPAFQDESESHLMAAMHSISSHTILRLVAELCSEKYQGRLTGTPGYDAAAEWTIGLMSSWNIKAGGGEGGFLQKFPNPYTLVLPGAELSLRLPVNGQAYVSKKYLFEEDFFPGSTSDSGSVTAEVVYAGYGITAPELGYDDYSGLDVRGKIVMIEPEVPLSPDREPEEFKKWRPYSFHDYKARNARTHGAAAIAYDYPIANPNCVFVPGLQLSYIGSAVADDIFAGTGPSHREVLEKIRKERKPASFATGKTLTIKNVTRHHPEGVGSNVIGLLEGSDSELRKEIILIGAHLDHLGLNPELMPGANDNASGVAVLLETAAALSRCGIPLKRSVGFILFGAEEQGVKGSEYFLAHLPFPKEKLIAFLNLESVGRGKRITAGSGKNYPGLFRFIEGANRHWVHRPLIASMNLNLARPRQDAAHFLWEGIPTISFGTTGGTPLPYSTYHTTRDKVEILDPEIMEDLARILFLAAVDMANAPTLALR